MDKLLKVSRSEFKVAEFVAMQVRCVLKVDALKVETLPYLKVVCSHCILIPQGSTGSSNFFSLS